jgi:hypothetical protein
MAIRKFEARNLGNLSEIRPVWINTDHILSAEANEYGTAVKLAGNVTCLLTVSPKDLGLVCLVRDQADKATFWVNPSSVVEVHPLSAEGGDRVRVTLVDRQSHIVQAHADELGKLLAGAAG